MKALSIQQPWAWAILHGGKDVENRTWPTKFRGRFVIHTGKRVDREGFEELRYILDEIKPPSEADITLGAFLGTAEIINCTTPDLMPENRWAYGPWCFVLRDVRLFAAPLPGRGSLGFFDVPPEVLKEIA